MSWSADKTLEFIEALELENPIWNPRNVEHKDRNVVYDCWRKLETKFNTPMKELKRKKDGLFATYRKLARKVAESKKSGAGTGDIFKPTWQAYEAMDRFLRSIYIPTMTINSLEIDEYDEEEVDALVCGNDVIEDHSTSSELSTINIDTSETIDNVSSGPSTAKATRVKKRKLTQSEQIQSQMNEALTILKSVGSNAKQSDEIELFTNLLCVKLKSLDKNTQQIAMHEIDNLIFRLKNPPPYAASQEMSPYYPQSSSAPQETPAYSPATPYPVYQNL